MQPNERRSSRAWRWLRDLGVLAIAVIAIRTYQQRGMPRGPAPELAGVDLEGAAVSLADYRGEPLLLHFWATWCGVCRAEQDSIDALARELPVVTIASQSGAASEVGAYVAKHGIVPRVVVDDASTIARRYGVRSFPTTFVLGPDGEIRFVEVGYTTGLGLRVRFWLAGLGPVLGFAMSSASHALPGPLARCGPRACSGARTRC